MVTIWAEKVFLKQITSEQQLVNHARAVKVNAWLSDVEIEDLIKGDILKESTCCIPNDS